MAGSASSTLRDVSRRLKSAPDTIVGAAAKVYADAVKAQLRSDGQRIAGVRLSVKVERLGSIATVSAAPRRGIGAWTILDSGTRAHAIRARRSRSSDAMNVPGVGWRTGPWRVRGVRGHNTWSKAMSRARAEALDAAHDEVKKVLS